MGQGSFKSSRGSSRSQKGTNILITGLYDVGKTTLVKELTAETPQSLVPFGSLERGTHKKLNFMSWDVGGRDKVRPLIRHFHPILDAIIYMVDSHDRELFEHEVVKEQLQDILSEEELRDLPLLILANKQDLPGALTCQQVGQELGLSEISRERAVEILPLSLVTEEGLVELRDWLELQQKGKQLHRAVIQPLEKAVPPTVTSAYSRMSSALKEAFGLVKTKLSIIS